MTIHAYRDPEQLPAGLRFLAGGGAATRLILDRDWSQHPLGEPAGWSEALKTALSTILNSPESMLLAWGRDELTFFFNETYSPLLGPRLSWAMGSPFREVWADGWAQARPIIDDAFAGRSQRFNDLPWKLGTDRGASDTWFTFSYSRILDAEGEVAGLFVFTNETTDRVLADAALRESEERFRLVIEGARDYAILTTDLEGTLTGWSAGAENVFGWTAAEAIGQPAALIFTPEDRAAGVDVMELTTAEAKGCANDERWHQTKSGERVFMNGSVHPLPADAQGRERGYIKVARDETEKWKARDALTRSEQLLRENIERVQLALSAGAIIGTWVWDLPTDRFTVDEGFAISFGLDPALGRDGLSLAQVVETVHPDDRPGLADAIDAVVRTGGPYAHQYRVKRADGHYYWIEANGRVDHGPDGTPLRFPGVLLDIEERRVVEHERDRAAAELRMLTDTLEQRVAERTAELMQAEEQLRQAQKMEAVGQLTGGLAHDFNNLLAGVSGALEMIGVRQSQGRLADVDKYIVAAQGAARRAAALTHRLLAFSRRQTLDPKPTDVNVLVNGMTDLIQRTVGPGIPVEAIGVRGVWTTLVDPSQLENALLNLCINARDAMPDGGRITIETANKWMDRDAARKHDMPEGQYLSLCVTDSGIGMSPEVAAQAFDPFFTTKPLGQGTGLGLSMIYGFAKQSGGQVRIYSEVNQGTTVCLYLPRYYGDAVGDRVEADAADAVRLGSGETVLIVDDEPTVRMLVTDVLEDLGYTVIEAADSVSGLKLLQSDARIDLLVSDVGLPGGMNGRQMAEAAREKRPGLRVLFVTGYAENSVIGNGHLEPGMQVLTKPFSVDTLAARVKELMLA